MSDSRDIRVLVCGGRDFSDKDHLFTFMDMLADSYRPKKIFVINGQQRGADLLSSMWAKARGLEFKEYPADWSKFGRRAGPVRNAEMLRDGKPDLVIAFPGGRGTQNMLKQARAAGIRVLEVASRMRQ